MLVIVTNRKGSATDWIMRAMAASRNAMPVSSPDMFHRAMACIASAKPIRMRASTRVERNPAGRQRQAGIGRGIAQHLLQQLGNELGGAEDDQAHQQHEDIGDNEIAVAEQLDVDDGFVLQDFPGDKGQETQHAYCAGGADEPAGKPVVALTAIKRYLQAPQKQR